MSKIRIELDGDKHGKVFVDDVEIPKVTRIQFEVGISQPGLLRLELRADDLLLIATDVQVDKIALTNEN